MDYQVEIEGGATFDVDPSEDSLLRAALRAGTGFPHECSVGGCGACRYDLLEGEVEDLWPEAPGLSERDRKRGKRLACQTRPRGDCKVKVRCDPSYVPPIRPERIDCVLTRRRMLTDDMAELSFEATRPVAFLPGQYALLRLPGIQGLRAYSMSNVANGSCTLQFIVRRTAGGAGSRLLVDRMALGSSVTIDGPNGHAYLREQTARPLVCIAGGSGLAPMLSVATRAAALGMSMDFFFGGRSAGDMCARPLLTLLPGFGSRLRLHEVVSGPDSSAWSGATGWVHEAVERLVNADAREREYYFAGPPAMIEALQEMLMVRLQVPYEQIHFDRFI
ncbi:MAG: hypothetical protein RL404_174 [Pseudomonadota bacterium]